MGDAPSSRSRQLWWGQRLDDLDLLVEALSHDRLPRARLFRGSDQVHSRRSSQPAFQLASPRHLGYLLTQAARRFSSRQCDDIKILENSAIPPRSEADIRASERFGIHVDAVT